MSSTPVIKCESVYKIFGANAKKMLQEANGNVDAKTFQDAGCIVGVNNASFEVSKGEMLVVMGLSGSGKSTLLRCISRLTDATAGKIFIEGQDLLSLKNKELIELRRNKMGMVFQSFALLPLKTMLAGVSNCSIIPSFIIAIRSASLSASSKSCVTNIIVFCNLPCSLKNSSCISFLINGSRAEKGSSKNQISGSTAKDLAIPTLCCCPPDNSLGK